MNKLLVYPLLALMIISAFYQVFTYSSTNLSYSNTLGGIAQEGQQTLDESTSSLSQETTDAVFDINMTSGFIALIIGLVAVGVLAGIHVLGSGLSEFANKLIYNVTVSYGLWGVFSALSFAFFVEIFLGFGVLIWFGMTLIYTLGFYETTWKG